MFTSVKDLKIRNGRTGSKKNRIISYIQLIIIKN